MNYIDGIDMGFDTAESQDAMAIKSVERFT